MIQFRKVRLHGFKSFVEKTEFDIGPGLTGIVGPNGCGKSNLVEALRWSMGENSSKKMRGGSRSMEDVIFNGTARRPARNMAEVSVLLDNSKRTAPAPYNNHDEIEVVRRIERDHGSGYKINGKNARARDVQLLYADILSGANSPYLVSQGKVANIIQAKPAERRMILEEAAGVTGLYARRHEAELRLRATDNNLKRLEDLLGGMEERLSSLKKQARQAQKYRNLSAQIRHLEVSISCLEWRSGHEKLREVESKFAAAESDVAEHLLAVSQLTKTQNVQAQDLPDLRQKEAELSATLQTRKLALQRLEDEEQRLNSQSQDFKNQREQALTDRTHEQQTLKENTAILERLDSEEKAIRANQDGEDLALKEREAARDELKEKVTSLESAANALIEKTASDKARRQGLEQQIETDRRRWETVSQRLATVKEQLAAKKAENSDDSAATALRADLEAQEQAAATLRTDIEAQEKALEKARADYEQRRVEKQNIDNDLSKFQGEINTLESVVNIYSEDGFRPVLDDIRTDEGFETALSRALGDTLTASADETAPIVWEMRDGAPALESLPPLPGGLKSLAPHIKAPAALTRALSQIGFTEDDAQGKKLAAQLLPGQSIVSRGGAYWRWDGLHIKAEASDRHALQLKQKNRFLEMQKELPAIEKKQEKAVQALEMARNAQSEAQDKLTARQADLQQAEKDIREKRIALSDLIESQASRQAELAKLEEALSIAAQDLEGLEHTLKDSEKALEGFDDAALERQQQEIEQSRAQLSAARQALQDAIREYDLARQDQSRRQARLQAIGDERVNLQNRCIRANERLRALDERETQLQEKIEGLKARPSEIRAERETLLSQTAVIETDKNAVSDRLAVIEGELADTTKALKEAEARLAEARERRAHAQATHEERLRHLETTKAHIREHFDMSPEELMAEAALDPENLPHLEELRQRKEKDVRARDMIGPVNLRADQEAQELESELGTILNERNDLAEAIAELRQGIQKLNKEARERLHAAFDHVNGHFRAMFTRLFNGGKAHLALIESDDPLEAGLEIFAEPPGKTLQSLSLLSGGEQTLTAVALIFAMFLTNPAPICVLDEVDAPLDDANVDRFCDMLEEFAERGETRFLVITHHRLTMARMDRLYGVTMAESGVSQLVSVDMNQQLDFLEAAE